MQTKSRLPSDQSDSETFIFIKFNALTLNTRTCLRLVDARALSLSFFLFPSSLSKGSASTEPALLSLLPCGSSGSKMKHVKTKARKMTRHEFLIILAKHEKMATQHRHGNRNQIHAILQKNSDCDKNSFNHISNTNYIRLHITIATIFIIEYNCIFNIRKADLSSAPHAPDGPVRAWRLTTGRLGTAAYVIGQIASMMSI